MAELQELEHWRMKFETAAAATEGYFSKRWVWEKVLGVSDEEAIRIQREMFFDAKFQTALETVVQAGMAQMAGAAEQAGGDMGLPGPGGAPPEEGAPEEPAAEEELPAGTPEEEAGEGENGCTRRRRRRRNLISSLLRGKEMKKIGIKRTRKMFLAELKLQPQRILKESGISL